MNAEGGPRGPRGPELPSSPNSDVGGDRTPTDEKVDNAVTVDAPTRSARFDDGRLLLIDVEGDEPPKWIEEYHDKITIVVVVQSALRSLAWAAPFKRLTEISVDNNRIATLVGCTGLPALQTLSLNMNVISDLHRLLSHCGAHFPELSMLSLLGNPCCPSEVTGYTEMDYDRYVARVRAALPRLKFLDTTILDPTLSRSKGLVLNPLKEAITNLKSRKFTRAVKDLGKVIINAAIVGKELGTDVSFTAASLATETAREFINGAKIALVNAAPSTAAAALSESDQLHIMQKQILPHLLIHDGAEVIEEATALYNAGQIDGDEYRRLLRLNGEMQQETAEINRSNTLRALEEFEAYVFPEVDAEAARPQLSVSEDLFSKGMRQEGLKHVTVNNVVKMLTHDQLPPALDLTNLPPLDVAAEPSGMSAETIDLPAEAVPPPGCVVNEVALPSLGEPEAVLEASPQKTSRQLALPQGSGGPTTSVTNDTSREVLGAVTTISPRARVSLNFFTRDNDPLGDM